MRASLPRLNRRRAGVILLAVISIAALIRLRLTCEAGWVIALEVAINALLVAATAWMVTRSARLTATSGFARVPQLQMTIGAALCILFPLIANWIERRAGQGTGSEIAYMGVLAWGGLVTAILAKLNRTMSMSVVCSGFLTLFTTVSSDHKTAIYFAFLWGVVCLWWLIANHWERIEGCQVDSVKSSNLRAPLAIAAGSLVFVFAAWGASGRSVLFNRLTAELMPTSGGSSLNDPSARSGVGDGDAVVAARDHAAAFGAVETDVFLDSPQPSLFDMFNDQFGEPVRKKKSERAIALANRENQSSNSRSAKSNSSTQSFTTHRTTPKPRKPLKDLTSNATMFWIGRTGERLATERYDRFDGIEWHQEEAAFIPKIFEQRIGERLWFGADVNNGLVNGPYADSVAEAVKFTRFRSNRIPAPAGVHLWHIDLVDQADFFGFTQDRCLSMPERDYVPDYTTVRLVNRLVDIERLEALIQISPKVSPQAYPSAGELQHDEGIQLAKQIAQEWVPEPRHNWQTIQVVIKRLRSDFQFDRSTAFDSDSSALKHFLTERRGSDVHFATAAAILLRELGFRTRFVTGFYVNPASQDRLTGQTPITREDAHAWLEVEAGSDIWIPLEPTPGFLQPTYRVTWAYQIRQNAAMIACTTLATLFSVWALWFSRAYLFEGIIRLLCFRLPFVSDRLRIRWLVQVLDRRCQLAGFARPRSVPPRDWLVRNLVLEKAPWATAIDRFFSEADRLTFGSGSSLTSEGQQACAELWSNASTFCLRRLRPSS